MAGLYRLGTALMAVGLLVMAFGALWQAGLLPGSQRALERPIAPERTATPAEPTLASPREVVSDTAPTSVTVATLAPPQRAWPTAAFVADAADRREDARQPRGGYAVRLAIPSIRLDTPVEQAGIVYDDRGNPIWQTLPFVAVHYGDLTALIGGGGNAVLAGHLVTQREGNVFRSLYLVDIDTRVQVWDERDREHDFRVDSVHLVSPDDTSPLQPTVEPTLTLITCGGPFDARTGQFSERLIVTGRPTPLE